MVIGEHAWAVRADDIEALDEHQLPALLRRLLAAEARGRHASHHVPEQIRAKDGGQDGYWHCPAGSAAPWKRETEAWIPADEVVYQCKAVGRSLGEALFCREIFPVKDSPQMKPAVQEVLQRGGAYVMLWRKQWTEDKSNKFRKAVEKRLKGGGWSLPPEAVIRVLDANQIAAWTNRHPSAVLYVNGFRNASMLFGNIASQWGAEHDFSSTFQDSAYLRGMADTISARLKEGRARIRLTGPSGVGKSRLIYEIIRREPLLEQSAVFIDAQQLSPESLFSLLTYAKAEKLRTLLVVDNCRAELHRQLEEAVAGADIDLITLSHDSSHGGTSSTRLVMEAARMTETIGLMLARAPQWDKKRDGHILCALVSYIDGLPALAEMILRLGRPLSPQELRTRTGVWQSLTGSLSVHARRVLKSLSLFPYIGAGRGGLYRQTCDIRKICCDGLAEDYYDDAVAELAEKGLLRRAPQSEVLWVTPTPLAAAYASEYIIALSGKTWERQEEWFGQMRRAGLLEPFIEQLDALERDYVLREATQLLDNLLIMAARASQSHEARLLFKALAKFNADRAIVMAERAFRYHLPNESMAWAAGAWPEMVNGLVELAWHPRYFTRAARLLLHRAAEELRAGDELGAAMRAFLLLFPAFSAETRCPARERLPVLQDALASHDAEVCLAGVQAFGAALSKMPYASWRPAATLRDVESPKEPWACRDATSEVLEDYWKKAFFLLAEHILSGGRHAPLAMEVLGKKLYAVITTPLILNQEVSDCLFRLIRHCNGVWPQALEAINDVLHNLRDRTCPHGSCLGKLAATFRSSSYPLSTRIHHLVSHAERDEYHSALLKVEQLAGELAAQSMGQGDLLPPEILRTLLQGKHEFAWEFGAAFGRNGTEAQLRRLFDAAYAAWPGIAGRRNPFFLAGVMEGMGREHPLWQEQWQTAGANPALVELLLYFARSAPIFLQELESIIAHIKAGDIPPERIDELIGGMPLKVFEAQQTAECVHLLQSLLQEQPEAAPAMLELLYVYLLRREWQYRGPFRELARSLLCSPGISELTAEWEDIAARELQAIREQGEARAWVPELFRSMCMTCLGQRYSSHSEEVICRLLARAVDDYPGEVLGFVATLLQEAEYPRSHKLMFRHSGDDVGADSWVHRLPAPLVEAWVAEHRELALDLLTLVPLCRSEEGVAGGGWAWCPLVRQLVEAVEEGNEAAIATAMCKNWGGGCYVNNERMQHWAACRAAAETLARDADARMRYIAELLLIDVDAELESTADFESGRKASPELMTKMGRADLSALRGSGTGEGESP